MYLNYNFKGLLCNKKEYNFGVGKISFPILNVIVIVLKRSH